MADAERCVSCGEIIPEGSWVCRKCLAKAEGQLIGNARENLEAAKTHINKALSELAYVKGN